MSEACRIEATWTEPSAGYVIRADVDRDGAPRFTVFRRDRGLWELVDARYPTYDEAAARVVRARRVV